MTNEERDLTLHYLYDMRNDYIEGEGYERHPLPEYYALEHAIEVLKATAWIPVTEKLPDEEIFDDGYVGPSDMVLITTADGTVTKSRYWGNRRSKITEKAEGRGPEYYDWLEAELWEDDVLAWMPLPERYKKDEEESI